MRQFLLRWGPVGIWAAVIFTLSSFSTIPKAEIIWWDFVLKKTAHVLEYAVFYFLLTRAITHTSPTRFWPRNFTNKQWLVALIIGILYAASDEFHQSFVPGRTPKVTDIGFDTVGMLLSRLTIGRHIKA